MKNARSGRMTVTFAGSGDAFGSGGRLQTCIHLTADGSTPVLLDCGATSLVALRRLGLVPGDIATVFVTHLHVDHFGGVPHLILDGQFSRRVAPLTVVGPTGTTRRLEESMAMMFPGSTAVRRRFSTNVIEIAAGESINVDGVTVRCWPADHGTEIDPSLSYRLLIGDKTISYTGDTAWTDAILDVADDSDLFIAEAYFWDKDIPYHLRHADLLAHRDEITSARTILTHLSADMLAHSGEAAFEIAHDGLSIILP